MLRDDIKQFINTCLDTVPNRSIATLAKRSGVNEQTIRNIYLRGRLPTITTLAAIARTCKLNISLGVTRNG